jgi:hypothetical protein
MLDRPASRPPPKPNAARRRERQRVAAATANGMPASHPVSLSGRLDSERSVHFV